MRAKNDIVCVVFDDIYKHTRPPPRSAQCTNCNHIRQTFAFTLWISSDLCNHRVLDGRRQKRIYTQHAVCTHMYRMRFAHAKYERRVMSYKKIYELLSCIRIIIKYICECSFNVCSKYYVVIRLWNCKFASCFRVQKGWNVLWYVMHHVQRRDLSAIVDAEHNHRGEQRLQICMKQSRFDSFNRLMDYFIRLSHIFFIICRQNVEKEGNKRRKIWSHSIMVRVLVGIEPTIFFFKCSFLLLVPHLFFIGVEYDDIYTVTGWAIVECSCALSRKENEWETQCRWAKWKYGAEWMVAEFVGPRTNIEKFHCL